MSTLTFHKNERLRLKSVVDRLFADGKSFMAFPMRVVWTTLRPDEAEGDARVAVMTIAPKRRLRHAVDRNHAKRLMREAYRQNKQPLIERATAAGVRLAIAFMLVTSDTLSQTYVERRMQSALRRISDEL